MTGHQGHLDRDTAERLLGGCAPLLGGSAATPDAGADRLAQLLTSAAAAPRAHELSGEDAAAMAFRVAAVQPRRGRRGFWRRLLTFKAIAALFAATTSGLAFASGADVMPQTFKVDPMPSPVRPPVPPVPPSPPVTKTMPATPPSTSTWPATGKLGHGCDHDADCDRRPEKSRSPKLGKAAKNNPRSDW